MPQITESIFPYLKCDMKKTLTSSSKIFQKSKHGIMQKQTAN
jgi:hypothetical protein